MLSPVGVSAKPVGSFGFSVQAIKDGITLRVLEMTVDTVAPNSEASRKGLAPLTQILGIDGRDIRDFTASFAKGSDLNSKLMDRKKGDQITLEVIPLGARVSKMVTLTQGLQYLDAPQQ